MPLKMPLRITIRVLVCFIAIAAVIFSGQTDTINAQVADQFNANDKVPFRLTPLQKEANAELKKRIEFWVSIYTKYTTREGVVHDAKYPYIVLEPLDFRTEHEDFSTPAKIKSQTQHRRIEAVKDYYVALLLSIHSKQKNHESLTDAEKRVAKLYDGISEPDKFYNAAQTKRVRFQLGQKDRFLQGLYYSGRYLPEMERVFREKGLPIELTRLPFVESSFNLRARSKVGASGIWQFMRATGKSYLTINDSIDERNDPMRATEAAAELLKLNFETLGTWPLAITAYNHGRLGLVRAVRSIGSIQLTDVIDNYRSRSFGFASSNFYTELMAAIEVESNTKKYFGVIERDRPIDLMRFKLKHNIRLRDIATYFRIPTAQLIDMNSALSDTILTSKKPIPRGYDLRLPVSYRDRFFALYESIPLNKKY